MLERVKGIGSGCDIPQSVGLQRTPILTSILTIFLTALEKCAGASDPKLSWRLILGCDRVQKEGRDRARRARTRLRHPSLQTLFAGSPIRHTRR